MPSFGQSSLSTEDVRKLEREGDIEGLIKALRYKNNVWGRHEAAMALGEVGGTKAVKPLITVLTNHKENAMVRGDAANSLGQLGDTRAISPLIATLKNHGLSKFAVWALEQIREPAVKPLITALKSKDYWARQTAAEALGKIGDERAVKPLIAALGDDNNLVKSNAARALSAITDLSYSTDRNLWQQRWTEEQSHRPS